MKFSKFSLIASESCEERSVRLIDRGDCNRTKMDRRFLKMLRSSESRVLAKLQIRKGENSQRFSPDRGKGSLAFPSINLSTFSIHLYPPSSPSRDAPKCVDTKRQGFYLRSTLHAHLSILILSSLRLTVVCGPVVVPSAPRVSLPGVK